MGGWPTVPSARSELSVAASLFFALIVIVPKVAVAIVVFLLTE